MLIKDTGAGGRQARDVGAAEDFTVTITPKTALASAGSTSTVTVSDVTVTRHTSSSNYTLSDHVAGVALNSYAKGVAQYSIANTGIATVNSQGVITPVSAGTTTITITVPGLGARKYTMTVTLTAGATTDVFSSAASGSLRAHLISATNTRLSGHSAPSFAGSPPYAWSSQINLFNAANTARNTSHWAGDVDWTCIPLYTGAGIANGVLVTPRDMICAAHWAPAVGTTYSFIGSNGTIYTRTVAAAAAVTGDIMAVTLSSDLPAAVTPCKVLPATIATKLPAPQYEYPCAFTNQDRTLLIGGLTSLDNTVLAPNLMPYGSWYYSVRGYDSGSPAFLIVNSEPVLLHCWYSAVGGPAVAANITAINAKFTLQGSPYSLTTVDLSGFNTY